MAGRRRQCQCRPPAGQVQVKPALLPFRGGHWIKGFRIEARYLPLSVAVFWFAATTRVGGSRPAFLSPCASIIWSGWPGLVTKILSAGSSSGGAISTSKTYSYIFDPIGRVNGGTQTTPTTCGQIYTFGASLKPTVGILSITYPNSGRVVTTGYDPGGRPATLAGQIGTNAPTNYVTATSYQPHGAIAQQTLGNGLVVTRCNGTACDK